MKIFSKRGGNPPLNPPPDNYKIIIMPPLAKVLVAPLYVLALFLSIKDGITGCLPFTEIINLFNLLQQYKVFYNDTYTCIIILSVEFRALKDILTYKRDYFNYDCRLSPYGISGRGFAHGVHPLVTSSMLYF